ncbi:DUF3604 domain-containing protein [Tropicimonas aquimaris]
MRIFASPSPRWTTYDAVRNGLPRPEGVRATIQERAWTSPIWHATANEVDQRRSPKYEDQETLLWMVCPSNAIPVCRSVRVLFGLPLR